MTAIRQRPWRGWLWAGIALTIGKLWLTRGQDVCAVATPGHDDLLFLQLADHLAKGEWLGAYDQRTLSVGPFYPLWIAAMFWLGVPLFLSQQVLYAGACALFTRACRPAVSRASLRFGLYALLLWNPMSFDASTLGRVLSQQVQAPLVLLVFAGFVGLHLRRAEPGRQWAPWAGLLGAAGAAFWLTGAEVSWLVPAAALLAGASLWEAGRESRAALRTCGRALLFAAVCAAVPVLVVCGRNYRHYDWFGTGEGRAPEFQHAEGALLRVDAGRTADVVRTAAELADFAASFRNFGASAPPSAGSAAELHFFHDLTRERISPSSGASPREGVAASALDGWKVAALQRIGKILRGLLFSLVLLAQLAVVVRMPRALWRRTWTYSLTLAAAAWSAGAAAVWLLARMQVASLPVEAVSSFAPIYPLLLVFAAAALWDAIRAARRVSLDGPRDTDDAVPSPRPAVLEAPRARALTWLAGLGALIPFVIWHRQFAELFWFGDDYLLVDQIANMGLGSWTWRVFSENFAPVFKLCWGGSLLLLDGSYLAMLTLLWLTHAANTLCLGRLLARAGFPLAATLFTQIVFALSAANIETLGWSVQWSAMLAEMFLLLGLLWTESRVVRGSAWGWRRQGPLVLLAAASACSFSRGVLTGPLLALALLLPVLFPVDRPAWRRALPGALLCLVPAAVVGAVIFVFASGNQQHMAGHWGAAARFAAGYFLLSPGWVLFGGNIWHPVTEVFLGTVTLAVIAGGLALTSGRVRQLLLVLLVYRLGDAVLLGIGRYHTGLESVISSRYCYSSLPATLPFAGILLARGLAWLPERLRPMTATVLLGGLAGICLLGWPPELRAFLVPRGAALRQLMQQPTTPAGVKVTVPSLDFMNVERAKALIRAYHLH